MTPHPHQPLYDLAEALAHTYGEHDPRSYDAVRVINALTDDNVLRAIAERTTMRTEDVAEYLVAMARLLAKETGT